MVKCPKYRKGKCPTSCNHFGLHKPNTATNNHVRCDTQEDYCGLVNTMVLCKPVLPRVSKKERERQQKLKDESDRRKKKFIKEYKALCLKHGCIVDTGDDEGLFVDTNLDPLNFDYIINEMLSK